MLPGAAHLVSAICHDLRFIVRKEFPSKETTRGTQQNVHKPSHGSRRGIFRIPFAGDNNDTPESGAQIQMCSLTRSESAISS